MFDAGCFVMMSAPIPGDLPEFYDEARYADLPREFDAILMRIPSAAARRHLAQCGVQSVTSDPLALKVRPTTSLLLILDIDETLVDARSAAPTIHIRPGAAALFARLVELRKGGGVDVWLWTAALDVHAARCVGVLQHAVGELPIDAVVVRGPEWMNPLGCVKDTRGLQLAACDRVLLVDNTPGVVLALPQSALVVPSYTYGIRHAAESRHARPSLVRVGEMAAALAAAPTARVADFLAGDAACKAGVRPWRALQGCLRLLYDVETAPPPPPRGDTLAPAPLTPPPLAAVVGEQRRQAVKVC